MQVKWKHNTKTQNKSWTSHRKRKRAVIFPALLDSGSIWNVWEKFYSVGGTLNKKDVLDEELQATGCVPQTYQKGKESLFLTHIMRLPVMSWSVTSCTASAFAFSLWLQILHHRSCQSALSTLKVERNSCCAAALSLQLHRVDPDIRYLFISLLKPYVNTDVYFCWLFR